MSTLSLLCFPDIDAFARQYKDAHLVIDYLNQHQLMVTSLQRAYLHDLMNGPDADPANFVAADEAIASNLRFLETHPTASAMDIYRYHHADLDGGMDVHRDGGLLDDQSWANYRNHGYRMYDASEFARRGIDPVTGLQMTHFELDARGAHADVETMFHVGTYRHGPIPETVQVDAIINGESDGEYYDGVNVPDNTWWRTETHLDHGEQHTGPAETYGGPGGDEVFWCREQYPSHENSV